jgi:hypothetical protein
MPKGMLLLAAAALLCPEAGRAAPCSLGATDTSYWSGSYVGAYGLSLQ